MQYNLISAFRKIRNLTQTLQEGVPIKLGEAIYIPAKNAEQFKTAARHCELLITKERLIYINSQQAPDTINQNLLEATKLADVPYNEAAAAASSPQYSGQFKSIAVNKAEQAIVQLAISLSTMPAFIVKQYNKLDIDEYVEITLSEIEEYLTQVHTKYHEESAAPVPLKLSENTMSYIRLFRCCVSGQEHYAIEFKNKEYNKKHTQSDCEEMQCSIEQSLENTSPTNVRIHSSCYTGDVLNSLRCDCNEQLNKSLEHFRKKTGIVIYLNQEGRGIGLSEKLKSYNLQRSGLDTVAANIALGYPSDMRSFQPAASILKAMGITNINLYSNNPTKIQAMQQAGIKVAEAVKLEAEIHSGIREYYLAKSRKMRHTINITHK